MNKKNLTLILILTFFLAVMVLAVLGQAFEKAGQIPANELIIKNSAGIEASTLVIYEEDGKTIKEEIPYFEFIVDADSDEEIVCDFIAEIHPLETTDDVLLTEFVGIKGNDDEVAAKTPNLVETTEKVEKEDAPGEYQLNPIHKYTVTFTKSQRDTVDLRFSFNTGGFTHYKRLRFIIIEKNVSGEDIDPWAD